jgi:lipoyl(octanoyl) transferase
MELIDLGQKSYKEAWEVQKELVEKRADGAIPDTLILVEHEPVYTVGRGGSIESGESSVRVKKLGSVPVVEVERGGKLTFHGPGQLVGYPIFGLPHRDLRTYLRDVERILMSVLLEETALPARPCPETLLLEPGQLQTGVWIRDRKIASIGIAVKRWVAYHGFALNLTTDLRYFEAVEPCGFHGGVITSVQNEMGADADMAMVGSRIRQKLGARFEELSRRYSDAVKSGTWEPQGQESKQESALRS